MSEMIERLAFAIEDAETDFDRVAVIGSAFPRRPSPKALAMARAAIKAMREPTGEMLDASGIFITDNAREIWRSMIDAAIR